MDERTDTIFGQIIDGAIPCHRVYEDKHVLAFLDVGPLAEGHTLVIPKQRVAHLHELDDDAAAALGRVLPRICRAIMKVTGCRAYNVLQNNGTLAHQVVQHVHFHVIPKSAEHGLGIDWPAGSLDDDAGAALAKRLRQVLDRD